MNALTTKERAAEFVAILESQRDKLAAALPEHITPEKFIRVVITAIQHAPELLKLDRQSLFIACLKAAQDGLLPDGRQGAIGSFNDKAQWMPMVGGLMLLARNSGQIRSLVAQVVHERDQFVWRPADTEQPIVHEVPSLAEDRGKPIGAYAIARLTSGEVVAEVMSRAEIEQVRAISRQKNGVAWSQWWGEMARKTVLRRLIKRLPLSSDRPGDPLARLTSAVERIDEDVTFEAPPAKPHRKGGRLDAIVQATATEEADAPAETVDTTAADGTTKLFE
jgi:recombination protein RecT